MIQEINATRKHYREKITSLIEREQGKIDGVIDTLEKSYHVCMTHIEIIDQRMAQHRASAAPQY